MNENENHESDRCIMNLKDYHLVWSDEFDYEGAPDPEKWNFETGNFQWPNKELQAYSDRPANVFVKNNQLTICSLKEQDGEREYTSSKLVTRGKACWQYGYFDIRAKFPKGAGCWPAIWLMPYRKHKPVPAGVPVRADGRPDFKNFTEEDFKKFPRPDIKDRWPNCGEIDLVEYIGRKPDSLLFSLHSGRHNHQRHDTVPYTTVVDFPEGFFDEFHNYSMEWTPDYFEYFVDGVSYCRYNKTDDPIDQGYDSWPFDKPFYLIMNTAVGGGLGGPVDDCMLPYLFEIEYVRVYQK